MLWVSGDWFTVPLLSIPKTGLVDEQIHPLTRIFHGIAETGGSVGLARRMGEVWGEQV